MNQRDAIRRSALWAAYGDALGFITELADSAMVRRRTGLDVVSSLMPWRRRIGGRFGVEIDLPKGCYSDDTQLRLATGRAIGELATFDAEAFAMIELPVWRAYALGAGRGTKAAAQSLARPDTHWWGNFFDSQDVHYIEGGGNGAAMRIQPHVWASPLNQTDSDIVREIIRNAVVTHGHPRGILGAAFHGLCLRHVIRKGSVPDPTDWVKIVTYLAHTDKIIRKDDELNTFWLPRWESLAKREIDVAVSETIDEMRRDIEVLQGPLSHQSSAISYAAAVKELGGLDSRNKGSGTKTAILASFLAHRFERQPAEALRTAANLLGSDTDTIGTMAGALLGAASENDPPESIVDESYVVQEAERMFLISQGKTEHAFNYPDLLYWQSPKTELDVLQLRDGKWTLAGLGDVRQLDVPSTGARKGNFEWQWFTLSFGQSVLLKRRVIQEGSRQRDLSFAKVDQTGDADFHRMNRTTRKNYSSRRNSHSDITVEEAVSAAVKSGLDPRVVGAMLVELAGTENGGDKAVAYARVIADTSTARAK